jgi:hypothetical protein
LENSASHSHAHGHGVFILARHPERKMNNQSQPSFAQVAGSHGNGRDTNFASSESFNRAIFCSTKPFPSRSTLVKEGWDRLFIFLCDMLLKYMIRDRDLDPGHRNDAASCPLFTVTPCVCTGTDATNVTASSEAHAFARKTWNKGRNETHDSLCASQRKEDGDFWTISV